MLTCLLHCASRQQTGGQCRTCWSLVWWLMITVLLNQNSNVKSDSVSEQAKKESWIIFCKQLVENCPYLKSATAIPFTTDPERKLNGTVNMVEVLFRITAFLGINELDQKFTVQGTFAMIWDLPSCAIWPEAKDGEYPDYCAVKRDDIWHPVFYHANGIGKESPFDKGVDQITVTHEGIAIWYVMGQFDASCGLSFKRFPFDEQTCSVSVKWQRPMDSSSVGIMPSMDVTGDAFSDTDVWALLNFKNKTFFAQGTERQVDFSFNVKRRPQAYFGNIFVPMILLMVLQTAVFLMPAEMGDRASISITVFLASAVLLSLLSQSIPSTAEILGISVAFCAQTGLGVFVTIYCLLTSRLAEHYPKAFRETHIYIKLINRKLTRINFYDLIAFCITIAAYAVINLSLFCLMYTTPSYSPFLPNTPPEVDDVTYNITLHRELGQAAADGRFEDVQRICSLPGVNVNWWDNKPASDCGRMLAYSPMAIDRAVACNRSEIVEYLLLEQKATTQMVDQRNNHTLLISGVLTNNTDIARMLLGTNLRVNQIKKDSHIFSPLAAAAYVGNFKVARILINRGADVNSNNSEGWTALMAAAERGDYDIVRLLVFHGADINAVDTKGRTAIDFAAVTGNPLIMSLLWPRAAEKITDEQRVSALLSAAMYGNPQVVDFLLNDGISANSRNQYNDTALLKAVHGKAVGYPGNCEQVVRSLLSAGAEVDASNMNGVTALMRAAALRSTEIARLLLDAGANVNRKDATGATPMMYAAFNGSLEMIQLLYDRRGSINVVTNYGVPPFSWAADNDDSRVLEWLFNKTQGREINTMGSTVYTNLSPLMRAAKNGREQNVRLLIDNGADLNAALTSGETALGVAIFANQYSAAKLIVEALFRKNVTAAINGSINPYGITPMHVAAYQGNTQIFKLLLERGADVNAVDIFGFTPLHGAILGKEPEQTTRGLLQKGSNVSLSALRANWSPLMFAAMKGNATVVKILLDKGADYRIMTDDITALHLAVAFGHSDATKAILRNRNDTFDINDFTDRVFESTVLSANDAMANFWPFASSPAIVPFTQPPNERVDNEGRIESTNLLKDYLQMITGKKHTDDVLCTGKNC